VYCSCCRSHRPHGVDLLPPLKAEGAEPGEGVLREIFDFYDIDQAKAWNEAKLHAFLEDAMQVFHHTRDVSALAVGEKAVLAQYAPSGALAFGDFASFVRSGFRDLMGGAQGRQQDQQPQSRAA
jgi:hypothetical protein